MDSSGINATAGQVLVVIPAIIWTFLVFRRASRGRERGLRLRAATGVWLATALVAASVSTLPGQVAALAAVTLCVGLAGSYRWLTHRQAELRYQLGGSYLFSRKSPSNW